MSEGHLFPSMDDWDEMDLMGKYITSAQLQAMSEPYVHALVRRELVRLLALRAGMTRTIGEKR